MDWRTCVTCKDLDGKIYALHDVLNHEPPLHEHCRCIIDLLSTVLSGSATMDGDNGADWWLKNYKKLPPYYINKQEAKNKGWKQILGNLQIVLPGKMIGGDIFYNRGKKLPDMPGRIWYEADINYIGGYRNFHRILFSNDGLVFVSYDHYRTFIEII